MLRQIVILAVVGLALSAPSSKVNIFLRNKSKADIAISFPQSTSPIVKNINSMRFASRGIKISTMQSQLEQLTAASQKNVLSFLEKKQINFRSMWINNHLYVEGASAQLIQEIANFPEVVEVREQVVVHLNDPKIDNTTTAGNEWGIEKIQAPAAWALPGGNNGKGVVVGVIDTGARGSHEALTNNHRARHGWHDAILFWPFPRDGQGHGTHVTGTIVGSHGIGVAPGAEWISCKALNNFGSGLEMHLVACGQWMTCPDRGACEHSPDVCSNSWGGLQPMPSYNPVIEAWHAADIIPVFAIGNEGSSCSSTGFPGEAANVIGVGSTDDEDDISYFSSRGPTDDKRIKPDISAPGHNIRSAGIESNSDYVTMSGTSMAAPHLAGVVAILKSRDPTLTYTQIKDLLQDNAETKLGGTAYTCGGIPSNEFPNHIYGHGRVNALASLTAAIDNSS